MLHRRHPAAAALCASLALCAAPTAQASEVVKLARLVVTGKWLNSSSEPQAPKPVPEKQAEEPAPQPAPPSPSALAHPPAQATTQVLALEKSRTRL